MLWVAPSEKDTVTETLDKRLWDAANQFRANSCLKPQGYSGPILGLIFRCFAEARFQPIHFEQKAVRNVIQNLCRMRDLLLPRLLSGQIDVGIAEKLIEGATA